MNFLKLDSAKKGASDRGRRRSKDRFESKSRDNKSYGSSEILRERNYDNDRQRSPK